MLKLCFLFVLGMLLLFAANVNAQVKSGSFSVSPFAGYSMFAHEAIVEGSSIYGGSLGYNFSESFGVEASYDTIDTEVVLGGVEEVTSSGGGGGPPGGLPPMSFGGGSLVASQFPPPWEEEENEPVILVPGGTEVKVNQARIEGLFYFYPWNDKFVPYATIGIGYFKCKYGEYIDEQMNAPIGLGLKYFLTDKIAVRDNYRFIMPMHKNADLLTVGVTFQFGGK